MAATTHQYVVALLTTDAVILDVDVRHHAAGALMHVTHVTVVFAVRAADGATGHVIAVVVATFGTLQRRRIHDVMSRFLIHIPPSHAYLFINLHAHQISRPTFFIRGENNYAHAKKDISRVLHF